MSAEDNESCSRTCLWLLAAAAIVVLAVMLWSIGTAFGQDAPEPKPTQAVLFLPALSNGNQPGIDDVEDWPVITPDDDAPPIDDPENVILGPGAYCPFPTLTGKPLVCPLVYMPSIIAIRRPLPPPVMAASAETVYRIFLPYGGSGITPPLLFPESKVQP